MTTFTIGVSTLAARTKTISAADTQRWIDAYKRVYGPIPDGAGGTRPRTNQEVFDAVADSLFLYMQEQVRNIEGDVAKSAILPITVS